MGLLGWARRRSLWVLPFGTSCCAADLACLFAPPHDLGGIGARLVREPALADVLVVAGRVTQRLAPVLRQVYDLMGQPRRVVAFGTCACSGGAFDAQGPVLAADRVVPVDAYVPGCPPEPEGLRDALRLLL